MTVTLARAGGSVTWSEAQVVAFDGGAFAVALGALEALPEAAFFEADDLTIQVGLTGETPSAPIPVGWAPRARHAATAARADAAGDADQLDGAPPSAWLRKSELAAGAGVTLSGTTVAADQAWVDGRVTSVGDGRYVRPSQLGTGLSLTGSTVSVNEGYVDARVASAGAALFAPLGAASITASEQDVAAGASLTYALPVGTTNYLPQAWVQDGSTWLPSYEVTTTTTPAPLLSDSFNDPNGTTLGTTDQGGAWTRFSSSDVQITSGAIEVWRPSTSTVDPAVYTALVPNGDIVVTGKFYVGCHQGYLLVASSGTNRSGIGMLMGANNCGSVSTTNVYGSSAIQFTGPALTARNTWYVFRMEVIALGTARRIRWFQATDGAGLPASPQIDYTLASPSLDGSFLTLSSNLSTVSGENLVRYDDIVVRPYPDAATTASCITGPRQTSATQLTVANNCGATRRVKLVVMR